MNIPTFDLFNAITDALAGGRTGWMKVEQVSKWPSSFVDPHTKRPWRAQGLIFKCLLLYINYHSVKELTDFLDDFIHIF